MSTGFIRQYGPSLALVICLIVLLSVWAIYLQGGTVTIERIVDFSAAVSERLSNVSITLTSLRFIVGGLIVLVLISTLSAWLQVHISNKVVNRYDLLIFVPSFVPVYVYGISLENQITQSPLSGFSMLIVVVAVGNGLWWWWHRQFVENLRALLADKAAAGIENMGLAVEQYYVLPEFVRGVWKKLPEMALWVLVNTLFVEAAVSEGSGILFELVRSLSDGGQSIDWVGVVTTVTVIVLVWLLIRWLSVFMLSRASSYKGWGFIRKSLLIPSNRQNYGLVVVTIAVILPGLMPVVVFNYAVTDSTPYWEFLGLMMSVSLVIYIWLAGKSLYDKVLLRRPNHRTVMDSLASYVLVLVISVSLILLGLGALSRATWELYPLTVYSNVQDDHVFINGKYEGRSPLKLRLPGGQYIVKVEQDCYQSREETIELASSQFLPIELEMLDDPPISDDVDCDDIQYDPTRPIPDDPNKAKSFFENMQELGRLFSLFSVFLFLSMVIFSAAFLAISGYFFSAHYKWKGNNWKWRLYQLFSQSLETLSRIPPYLLLVITIFWLGFQTFGGCTKQFGWTVVLLLVLLPTQLLRVSSWIEEVSSTRFLTARRSLGVSAFSTFCYLLNRRWAKGVIAIVVFSVGLGLLMDISMVWLLGERGSFTCDGKHWLTFLGSEKPIQSWQSFLVWFVYPLLMLGLVRKTSNL